LTFDWSTDVGMIAGDGTFTAPGAACSGTVTATVGAVSGFASVEVVSVPIDHVVVIPGSVSVPAGGSQQFTAVAYDATNNVILGVSFVWSTDCGFVDSEGMLTADTVPWDGYVSAAAGTIVGTAAVSIVPAAVNYIVVMPDPTSVVVGGGIQFAAMAYDAYGNPIPGEPIFWTTNVGAVNATGYLSAQTVPGVGWVRAASGSVVGTSAVTVEAGPLDHIIVSPDNITMAASGVLQFTAVGYDSYGNQLTGLAFAWSATVGTIDASGLLTAQSFAGAGTVQATSGIVSGAATVSVTEAEVYRIEVVPGTAAVTVGGSQQFTAHMYDAADNEILGLGVVWTTDAGTIDADGLLTAMLVAGAGSVTATHGLVAGAANVTIVGGSFTIQLVEGWNLVSLPLIPDDPSVPEAMSAISGKWDRLMWYNSADTLDHWKQHYTGWPSSFNDLVALDCTMGFWLHVLEATEWTVYGRLPENASVSLRAGWNMVGFPVDDDRVYTVAQFKADTGASVVEGFDEAEEYRTRVLEDTYEMKRGEGYWTYVPSDSVWTVLNEHNQDGSDADLQMHGGFVDSNDGEPIVDETTSSQQGSEEMQVADDPSVAKSRAKAANDAVYGAASGTGMLLVALAFVLIAARKLGCWRRM
jgi:hypothetical protein